MKEAALARHSDEEEVRTRENQAFTELQRQAAVAQHEQRLRGIDARLMGLRQGASEKAIRMFEGQRRKAMGDHQSRLRAIDEASTGYLDTEPFAVIRVEVGQ